MVDARLASAFCSDAVALFKRGDIRRGIDLVEPLSRLDVAAFLEVALQYDAVDTGAYLRHEIRGRPPRQLGRDRHAAPMHCHDRNLRRRQA